MMPAGGAPRQRAMLLGRLVYSGFRVSTCLMVGVGVARVTPLRFAEALQHRLVHGGVGRVIQIEHRASCNINIL